MEARTSSPDLFDSQELAGSPMKSTPEKVQEAEWRGCPVSELLLDGEPWRFWSRAINPGRQHTVLYELPLRIGKQPLPHRAASGCRWDKEHVRLPFSPQNLYPVRQAEQEEVKQRWELIQLQLLQPIHNSQQLQRAIFSYNMRHCELRGLHHLFQDTLDEEESLHFFQNLLPQIVQLALQLPDLVRSSLPLLKQGRNHALSMSQLQIASLLANAFLCTFPWRREMATYPGINFNRLFECDAQQSPYIIEKIKCLLHYFRRVCAHPPTGVVTFERKHVSRTRLPRWDKLTTPLTSTKMHVSSQGTIEDGGLGMLQLDFANCMLGGGVLGHGCVQEEIRFVICPELLVSRLFTEQLGPTEALQITGVERFSKYEGYADGFRWAGDYRDQTPLDANGRRRTSILAIDALYYNRPAHQFAPSKMMRELNKAYAGFHEELGEEAEGGCLSPVATGNWGCGAFRGNAHLKALLQLMASTAANRHMLYYTFGDEQLRDTLHSMHDFLSVQRVTVCQLWRYLCRFNEAQLPAAQLYSYIRQLHLQTVPAPVVVGSEAAIRKMDVDCVQQQNQTNRLTIDKNYVSTDSISRPKLKRDREACHKNHQEIKQFLYSSDEEEQQQETPAAIPCERMDISDPEDTTNSALVSNNTPKKHRPSSSRKISDYFKAVPK